MRLAGETSAHHGVYCLNVFPDDTLSGFSDQQLPALQKLKGALCPDRKMGLGLRFSAESLSALDGEKNRRTFLDRLREHDVYGLTFNAFPYGAFHGQPVKERVYAPDWRTQERLNYTLSAARLVADTLGEESAGSVSTVPGSYSAWMKKGEDCDAVRHHLMRAVKGLRELELETGRYIHLGLEPEPDGWLETTEQCVRFWKDDLFHSGAQELASLCGVSRDEGEEWIRRYLGVCFDACHLAIQFEPLADSVRALHREGILISKAHISAALDVRPTPETVFRLTAFDEPVYLHQVKADTRQSWRDLNEALDDASFRECNRARIHFHVPLTWTAEPDFSSTVHEMSSDFFAALREAGCEHLEVETYTFDVLPKDVEPSGLTDMMIAEMRWLQTHWENSLAP